MTDLKQLMQDFLAAYLPTGTHAYAGFSGGADSTALLLLLHQCHIHVTAVHFHHGLRGEEADADALWSRQFCEKRNIPYIEQHLELRAHQLPGESCEACGRRLRLAGWKALCSSGQPVFLAHHRDDVLEELFLRLARGGNASSLTPIHPKRLIDGICFLRPLLSVRRRHIEAYLTDEGICDWRVDSTNLENEFRRNRVRNQLLPLYREIFDGDSGVIQAIQALYQDGDCLDQLAKQSFPKLQSLDAWRTLHPALFFRCVRLLLEDTQVTSDGIQRLHEAVHHYAGRQLTIPMNGRELYVTSEGIAIAPQPWTDVCWNWQVQPQVTVGAYTFFAHACTEASYQENFESSSLPAEVQIRHWRPGDQMIPFGSPQSKKLQDLFSDAKIPRYLREHIPVLEANGQIIWVPGLRRAEFGRRTTDRTVCLAVSSPRLTPQFQGKR